MLGRFKKPVPGLDVILGNALAVIVEKPKVSLGLGVALLGARVKLG